MSDLNNDGLSNIGGDWFDVPGSGSIDGPDESMKSYKDLSLYHLIVALDHIQVLYGVADPSIASAINQVHSRDKVFEDEYNDILDSIIESISNAHKEHGGEEIVLS